MTRPTAELGGRLVTQEVGRSYCHVLEAEQIGFGGSGRNCGLVNAALWLPPQIVREKLGPEYGPRFIQRFGDGPEYVFSLIEKHQIQCEVTRTGTIHGAHSPKGFEAFRMRFWLPWPSSL